MFIVSLTEEIVSIPKTIWLFLLRKIYVVYSEKYIEKMYKSSEMWSLLILKHKLCTIKFMYNKMYVQ
jgi:hypothetical protein